MSPVIAALFEACEVHCLKLGQCVLCFGLNPDDVIIPPFL